MGEAHRRYTSFISARGRWTGKTWGKLGGKAWGQIPRVSAEFATGVGEAKFALDTVSYLGSLAACAAGVAD